LLKAQDQIDLLSNLICKVIGFLRVLMNSITGMLHHESATIFPAVYSSNSLKLDGGSGAEIFFECKVREWNEKWGQRRNFCDALFHV